jgi:peroxiredoxin
LAARIRTRTRKWQVEVSEQKKGRLTEALEAAARAGAARLSDEGYRLVREVVARQEASGLADEGVQIGENVPDFALPDVSGRVVSLNDLLNDGPAVVVFYRGGWCPFCELHLRALHQARPEIEARGAKLVAISLEKPDAERSAARKIAPSFRLLHDRDGRVAKLFGLLYDVTPQHAKALANYGVDLIRYHGGDTPQLPLAATYVVGQDGVVTYGFVDVHPEKRAEPDDIIAALDAMRGGAATA